MSPWLKATALAALTALPLVGGCADATYTTPLEAAGADSLTSHEAMMGFLGELQAGTRTFTMDTVGTSVEGRPLVLLHFDDPSSTPESEKLKLYIFAQQHGNEPSGKEAAIALARDIATGIFADFLGRVDLYLLPQVNPDGSELRQRQNADDRDLNRDHLTLTTPEVRAVHQIFNRIMPHVALDVHEYGITSRAWEDEGWRKNFGQQIDALTNPNMSERLRTYGVENVIGGMREMLAPRDVQLHRYLVTDGPDERFRHSTTALNDGRNSTGIYNTLSFLIEGRNGLTASEDIRERARQQLETMKAFITYFAEHTDEVKTMVEEERRALAEAPAPEVQLVMDYVKDPAHPTVTVGVINLETGAEEEMVIEAYYPRVESTLTVSRPLGYALPASLMDVTGVLERHGIPMTPLAEPLRATVESYRIDSVVEEVKEDKAFLNVGVSAAREPMAVPEGYVVVWSEGLPTNLVASLLEPQSMWGLAPLPEYVHLLEVGSTYPVLRVVEVRR